MTQDKLVFDILVVETKELTREMVKRILQQKGFSVDTAVDGKDAIDKLRRNNYAFGLVITEIIMSYAGGFEVIETVKRESSVPVMVLSAVADENTIQEAFRLNADDFLKKPFMAGELVQRVQRLLARTRAPKYAPVQRVPAREELKKEDEIIVVPPVVVPEPPRSSPSETVFIRSTPAPAPLPGAAQQQYNPPPPPPQYNPAPPPPPQYNQPPSEYNGMYNTQGAIEDNQIEEEEYEEEEEEMLPVRQTPPPPAKETLVATVVKQRLKRESTVYQHHDADDDPKTNGMVKKSAIEKKNAAAKKKTKLVKTIAERKRDYEL